MRKLFAMAFVLAGFSASQLAAQGYGELGGYWATIAPEDMYNSRGVRLTTLGAVLQQDRANFHRFGIRQQGDESDPVFFDRATRARLPALYQQSYKVPELEAMVRSGQPFRVYVFICGSGGRPSNIAVVPEWIGDHSGCF